MLPILSFWLAATTLQPLKPLADWSGSRASDGCVLTRSFGDQDNPISITLRPIPTFMSGMVTVSIPPSIGVRVKGKGKIGLGPDAKSFSAEWNWLVGGGATDSEASFTKSFWDSLPATRELVIYAGGSEALRLDSGLMHEPMIALKGCNDTMLRGWGADPAAMLTPTTQQMLAWFRPDDYPSAEMRAGHQGRVLTLSSIDPDGKPADCRVVSSSGWPSLDSYTCSLALARFRLPKAPKGETHPRYFLMPSRWIMP